MAKFGYRARLGRERPKVQILPPRPSNEVKKDLHFYRQQARKGAYKKDPDFPVSEIEKFARHFYITNKSNERAKRQIRMRMSCE